MKKLNKIINFLLIFTLLFSHIPIAKAAGSANVSFSGASSATVGTNIEITMVINNINGAKAIQSFGGILEYDDTYLQYVSFAKIVDFSSGKYNETSKKLSIYAGDTTEWATGSSNNMVKFVFKPLKSGSNQLMLI